ncbi:hypothetical protein TNCV_3724051 [Trichonephila clavipes]|nr:hypothetical protein TNCV_3724051 [Trichonephila clavipes]
MLRSSESELRGFYPPDLRHFSTVEGDAHNGQRRILFTEEKAFNIEESSRLQNARIAVYARIAQEAKEKKNWLQKQEAEGVLARKRFGDSILAERKGKHCKSLLRHYQRTHLEAP